MIFMRHPDPIDIHNIVSVDAAGSPDWAFPLHAHPHHLEISLVLSGGGLLYFGGRSYVMKKGDLSIKNAGVVHAEHTDPRDPIRQILTARISGSNIHAAGIYFMRRIYGSDIPACES